MHKSLGSLPRKALVGKKKKSRWVTRKLTYIVESRTCMCEALGSKPSTVHVLSASLSQQTWRARR